MWNKVKTIDKRKERKMKMERIYTVDYFNGNKIATEWFDDLAKAEKFAKKENHDQVVIHLLRSKKSIDEAKHYVALTNYEFDNK